MDRWRYAWLVAVPLACGLTGASLLPSRDPLPLVRESSPSSTSSNSARVAFPAEWTRRPPGVGRAADSNTADQIYDPPAVNVFPSHDQVASNPALVPAMVEAGRRLFAARFNRADGAGRPGATGDSKPTVRLRRGSGEFIRTSGPDANSCAGCHNQPTIGGSGDFVANVFVGAQFRDPPTSSIDTAVTSERNTIGLFGSGAIDVLAREMTGELLAQRTEGLAWAGEINRDVEVPLRAKGVSFGTIVARTDGSYDTTRLEGVDPDLALKPFGAKGVAVGLREFSINALNHHHGIQAVERFGWERTGRRDFDDDGVEVEFTVGQVSAMVVFQASLPAPRQATAKDEHERTTVARGEVLFGVAGCGACHLPALHLNSVEFSEPDPYNRPGNIVPEDVAGSVRVPLPFGPFGSGITQSADGGLVVAAYTDLKRHRICDAEEPFFCNEKLRQDNVPTDQFLTAKLWDLAVSAPYGHRGDCPTISEAILHHGAEGAAARRRFQSMNDDDKRALVKFLLSLGGG